MLAALRAAGAVPLGGAAPRVIVGVSGGVDSSVAALLLAREGFAVTGVYMRNWDAREERADGRACGGDADADRARRVCGELGLPFRQVDFVDAYWSRVFDRFLAGYAAGRTPNPDVWCNREIKFGAFRAVAAEAGADFVATGAQRCCGAVGRCCHRSNVGTAIEHAQDTTHGFAGVWRQPQPPALAVAAGAPRYS